jgi:hypothetical protein
VRELGEKIGQQPTIDEANVDDDLLARAEARGNELWAQDLLDDLEVETVQGSVRMDEIVEGLTPVAVETLLDTVDFDHDTVVESDWETAMTLLRTNNSLSPDALQRTWWLFPVYRDRPSELQELLREVAEYRTESTATDDSNSRTDPPSDASVHDDSEASLPDTATGKKPENRANPNAGETADSSVVESETASNEPENPDPEESEDQPDEASIVSRLKSLLS